MDDKTTYMIQRSLTWIGPVWLVLYLFFWVYLGHNFPPPSPSFSGEELIANYYAKYRGDILAGMSVCAGIGMFYAVWSVQLSCMMWQREKVPILSLLQLIGGVLTAWVVTMCPAMWAWCAAWAGTSRVDPEMVKGIHLITHYIYIMTWMITTIQAVSVGIFALLDRKNPAILPAWAAWLVIVCGISFIPCGLLPFYVDGPFAVDGWYNFHLIYGTWGLFFLVTNHHMMAHVKRIRIAPQPGIGQALSHVP